MIEIFGLVFGGIARMVPEVFHFLDKKNERKHELEMFDKQLAADRARSELRIGEMHAEAEGKMGVQELEALTEAIKGQSVRTGIGWVDAFNAIQRPLITFQWVILLWPSVIIARFWIGLHQSVPAAQLIVQAFGEPERAVAMSIVSFWFVDRSLRKITGR